MNRKIRIVTVIIWMKINYNSKQKNKQNKDNSHHKVTAAIKTMIMMTITIITKLITNKKHV